MPIQELDSSLTDCNTKLSEASEHVGTNDTVAKKQSKTEDKKIHRKVSTYNYTKNKFMKMMIHTICYCTKKDCFCQCLI